MQYHTTLSILSWDQTVTRLLQCCRNKESIMGASAELSSPEWVCIPKIMSDSSWFLWNTNSQGWTLFRTDTHDRFYFFHNVWKKYSFISFALTHWYMIDSTIKIFSSIQSIYTVQCRYNVVHFLQPPHDRHSIAHLWGRHMSANWDWCTFCLRYMQYIYEGVFNECKLGLMYILPQIYAISCYIVPRYNGTQLYKITDILYHNLQ